MRKIVLLLTFMLIITICYSQPMLGRSYDDVKTRALTNTDFHDYKESVTPGGFDCISVFNSSNDVLKWFFKNGVVDQYCVIVDDNDLNAYIKYLEDNFIKIGSFKYKDYSSGTAVYWYVTKSNEFYRVTASYSMLDI